MMKPTFSNRLFCSLLFVVLTLDAPARSNFEKAFKADKLPELDSAIEKAIADGTIVGASLWVEREGESYHKAFGNLALKPTIEPMTENALFDVASITKVLPDSNTDDA